MDTRGTGLMVIRAWIEEGSIKPLRAEIRHTSDVSAGFTSRATLTELDRVLAEVRAFLTTVVSRQR